MAFFKSRTAGKDAAAPHPSDSIEAMRKRARHRLIGATVLVLIGVVGFPLLFDNQPRPIAVDIPIEIPDRNHAKPLPLPGDVATAPMASGRVTPPAVAASAQPAPKPAAPASVAAAPASGAAARVEAPVTAKPEATPASKPRPEAASSDEPKPAAKPAVVDDGSRAKALLEGNTPAPIDAAEGRFVVQVGAFADPAKARETRLRVERAGLKTYTHVAETRNGRRIRVRVGPFATRAEADKAASKIKGLDLPAAILTL